MSKTDGILLDKINNVKIDRINLICFISMLIWICSSILMSVLNLINAKSYTYHGAVIMLLYLSGGLGLIFGGIRLYRLFVDDVNNRRDLFDSLQPVLFLFLLLLWSLFCVLFAEEKRIAIYGYEMFRDNIFTFLFYFGLVLLGITASLDKKRFRLALVVFVIVASFLSMLQLANVSFTFSLFRTSDMTSESNPVGAVDSFLGEYLLIAIFSLSYIFFTSGSKHSWIAMLPACIMFVLLIKAGDVIAILLLIIAYIIVLLLAIKKHEMSVMIKCLLLLIPLLLILCAMVLMVDTVNFQSFEKSVVAIYSDRIVRWGDVKNFLRSAPIVGVGPQNTLQSAKNSLLQTGMYMGVPGILIFVMAIILVFEKSMHNCGDFTKKVVLPVFLLVFTLDIITMGSVYYILAYYFLFIGAIIGNNL